MMECHLSLLSLTSSSRSPRLCKILDDDNDNAITLEEEAVDGAYVTIIVIVTRWGPIESKDADELSVLK